jgi:hypothetical protein
MKRTMAAAALVCMLIAHPAGALQNGPSGEQPFISVPVSILYTSTYWWRGVELNDKGAGVIWPSIGLGLAGTGLSFVIATGVNVDSLAATDRYTREKTNKYHEFDYGAAYTSDIGDWAVIGAGLMYIHYPFYDSDGTVTNNNSFFETSFSISSKTILNPRLDLYYDCYIKENADIDPQGPRFQDFYIKLSCSQDVLKAGDFSASVSAWVGYYNNPYRGRDGFSDMGLKIGTARMYMNTTFAAGFYYAYSLTSDFQVKGAYGSGGLKHHVWADFGISHSF